MGQRLCDLTSGHTVTSQHFDVMNLPQMATQMITCIDKDKDSKGFPCEIQIYLS